MIPMELKKLGNGNAAMEWKKILSILRTRRTAVFLSGFAFTLFLCSVLVFVNNVNPLNQGQTWLPPMFSNSSGSNTIFTFFFPNSDSSKVDKSAQDPQGKHASVVDDMSTMPEEGLKNKENGKNSTQETPLGVSVPNGSGDVVSGTDSSNQVVNTKKDPQEPRGESVGVGNKERMPDDGLKTRENGTDSSVPMSPRDLVKKKDSSAKVGSATNDPGKAHDQSVVDKKEVMPNMGKGVNGTQQTLSNGSVPIKSGEPDLVNKTASSGFDKPLEVVSGNGTATWDLVSNITESKGAGISNGSSEAAQEKKKCDIFSGRWAPDDTKPLYPPGSCPYIDESFNCFLNRRPDRDYEKWRWQPNDCDIPRFNAADMLERLRGKRLAYVGDSLNRNMWESMVCMLRHAVANKSRVFEISGKKQFRTEGFYSFMYEDYNCSVDFIRAPFLVQEWEVDEGNGTKKETLRLDLMDSSTPKYKDADIIVFNTGHWWTHEKTSKGKDYYQEGDHVYPDLNVLEAYKKALNTWAKWVDSNINPKRTTVFFRGYSATHFSGGQWNSGGQCHQESEPIYNETYITKYNSKMLVFESVIQGMTTPVNYLNITRITDYRKDAHPSIYRKQYLSQEERIQQVRYQDCSHWCLPGVPDTWNELVYASLLLTGKGVWAT